MLVVMLGAAHWLRQQLAAMLNPFGWWKTWGTLENAGRQRAAAADAAHRRERTGPWRGTPSSPSLSAAECARCNSALLSTHFYQAQSRR